MSGRSRGKPFRGGGRGNYGGGGGQWIGHRGRGGYRGGNHRGGVGGYRGGRGLGGRQDNYYMNREMRGGGGPHRQQDPEKLLSNLAPEAQLALTTAIINSVLKTDGREGRGNYREREFRPTHRDGRREGRGGYFREEQRDRRHYGEDRRPHDSRPMHEEGRGHHYEREKSAQGPPRYRNNRYPTMHRRRPSPHSHMGQARKRMRMERMASIDGDTSPRRSTDYEGDELGDQERKRLREHKRRSPGQNRERNGREDERRKRDSGKDGSPDGAGGVQVTIGADGERNVNNEGNSRPGGIHFVELRCPHCPGQMSITFKEYKFHLSSEAHKGQLNRLARKHSVVLRKIRVQQRQEQRDIEAKWKEDKADEFKISVTRFCNTCKLAYKCPGTNTSEGISQHNGSKLHRMQQSYLHPRCGPCRSSFPSRMVYEYHIASIHHLRAIDKMGRNHQSDDPDQDDDDDDLDLANFMTLDAVGEDDEVGSEHEEITGGLDEAEAAKEAETGSKQSLKDRFGRDSVSDDESVEADWDKEKPEEDEEENESVGSGYVNRIDAYFCSLCSKIFRADTSIGSRAVQRHCRTFDHLAQYQDAHPPTAEVEEEAVSEEGDDEQEDAVSDEGGNDDDREEVDDDPEQEKLWEEVDKGLDMLQGEIMTDIEAEDRDTAMDCEDNSKTKKIHKKKIEKNKSDKEEVESNEGEIETTNNLKRASSEEQDEEPDEKDVEAEESDEEK